jgi:hypothetical protein
MTESDLERTRLAKVALAAWVNVDPDKLPAEKMWIEHPSDENRKAWDRVIEALRLEFQALTVQGEGNGSSGNDPDRGSTGWRPIDSAPRDGRRFVGLDAEHRYLAVGYYDARGEFEQVDRTLEPMSIGFYPTHWMPLPDPPATPANETRAGGVS